MKSRLLLVALAPLLGVPLAPALAKDECSPSYDKPDQTIADCTGLLSRNGLDNAKKAAALQIRAGAFERKKDFDRALADLTQAIGLDASNAQLFFDRASLYRFELKNIDRSFADIGESIRLEPGSYAYISFRGDLDLERNDLAAATTDYGEEIRLNPTGVGGYYSRGQVWVMRGDYKHALDDFEAGFKLSPDYSNVINSRNRTHATLAVGTALASAEGLAPGSTPNFQASPTKDLYSEARSWKDGDALHHCTLEFDEDKTALAVGRGRSGYVLALASGQWSLAPGSSYPVQVSIGSGPSKQATATVIDPITIAIPLADDKDFVERTKGYGIPISIQAGQNTIKAPTPGVIDYADKLEACWSKATAAPAKSNPFGSPTVASAPAASLASNPFAVAGRVAALPGANATPAPAATRPEQPSREKLVAFLFGTYARWAGGNCDLPTTKRQRDAIEAKLTALKPEVKEAEAALVKEVNDNFHCPEEGQMMTEVQKQIQRFGDNAPEAFVAGLPDHLRLELTSAVKEALPNLAAK